MTHQWYFHANISSSLQALLTPHFFNLFFNIFHSHTIFYTSSLNLFIVPSSPAQPSSLLLLLMETKKHYLIDLFHIILFCCFSYLFIYLYIFIYTCILLQYLFCKEMQQYIIYIIILTFCFRRLLLLLLLRT